MTEDELDSLMLIDFLGLFPRHKLGDRELLLLRLDLRPFHRTTAVQGFEKYRRENKWQTPDLSEIMSAVRSCAPRSKNDGFVDRRSFGERLSDEGRYLLCDGSVPRADALHFMFVRRFDIVAFIHGEDDVYDRVRTATKQYRQAFAEVGVPEDQIELRLAKLVEAAEQWMVDRAEAPKETA